MNIEGDSVFNMPSEEDETPQLYSLVINGSEDDQPTVRISGPAAIPLTEFNITNIHVKGNIEVTCGEDTDFRFHLENVRLGEEKAVRAHNISKCATILVNITDTIITNSLVLLGSIQSSQILLDNVNIVGSRVGRKEGTGTGVAIELPEEGKHFITVHNCTFEQLYQNLDLDKPRGALSLFSGKADSEVQMAIVRCTFVNNTRAIDASLYGTNEIEIDSCLFDGNAASGSGGAIRFTQTKRTGLGAFTELQPTRIRIADSHFQNNMAFQSNIYDEDHVYYQTRSPGSGGAIFVFLTAQKAYDHKDGIVWIEGCTFKNNSAAVQGGTVFVNPDISTYLGNLYMERSSSRLHPKFGDIIYSSCNMTLENVSVNVGFTDGHTPIISYQASNPSLARLLATNTTLVCPAGHWGEQLNTSSLVASLGIEALQLYCRACSLGEYSLNISEIQVRKIMRSNSSIIKSYKFRCVIEVFVFQINLTLNFTSSLRRFTIGMP